MFNIEFNRKPEANRASATNWGMLQ